MTISPDDDTMQRVIVGKAPSGGGVVLSLTSDGKIPVEIAASSNHYYSDDNIKPLTNTYQELPFGFESKHIIISNDSSNDIQFKFTDGGNDEVLKAGEVITLDWFAAERIYLKGAAGGEKYRLWVW